MKTVTVDQAKTHLENILAEIENGGARHHLQTRLADRKSVPHKNAVRSSPHPVMRNIWFAHDLTEPMASDEWPQLDR